jgi:hypothetical protein
MTSIHCNLPKMVITYKIVFIPGLNMPLFLLYRIGEGANISLKSQLIYETE